MNNAMIFEKIDIEYITDGNHDLKALSRGDITDAFTMRAAKTFTINAHESVQATLPRVLIVKIPQNHKNAIVTGLP